MSAIVWNDDQSDGSHSWNLVTPERRAMNDHACLSWRVTSQGSSVVGWWRSAGLTELAEMLATSARKLDDASALGHEEFQKRWREKRDDPISHFP
jgi:hypothetical protein